MVWLGDALLDETQRPGNQHCLHIGVPRILNPLPTL